jgi:hypothetical protein
MLAKENVILTPYHYKLIILSVRNAYFLPLGAGGGGVLSNIYTEAAYLNTLCHCQSMNIRKEGSLSKHHSNLPIINMREERCPNLNTLITNIISAKFSDKRWITLPPSFQPINQSRFLVVANKCGKPAVPGGRRGGGMELQL